MSLAHPLWKKIEYRDKLHHADVLLSLSLKRAARGWEKIEIWENSKHNCCPDTWWFWDNPKPLFLTGNICRTLQESSCLYSHFRFQLILDFYKTWGSAKYTACHAGRWKNVEIKDAASGTTETSWRAAAALWWTSKAQKRGSCDRHDEGECRWLPQPDSREGLW